MNLERSMRIHFRPGRSLRCCDLTPLLAFRDNEESRREIKNAGKVSRGGERFCRPELKKSRACEHALPIMTSRFPTQRSMAAVSSANMDLELL
jgi:hypothetical protein